MILQEISDKLINLITFQLDLKTKPILSDELSTLGMDSLDNIEFIMRVEKEFNIDIDDMTFAGIESIQDVIDIIQKEL